MKSDEKGCAALKNNRCSIYQNRPFYCRMYPLQIYRVVSSTGWGVGDFFVGYALVEIACPLLVDFNKEVDIVIAEVQKNKIFFQKYLRLIDKYQRPVNITHLRSSIKNWRFIDFGGFISS